MTIFQNSRIARFTRGGQTLFHYCRMISQVGIQILILSGVLFLTVLITVFLWKSTTYERYIGAKYIWAYSAVKVGAESTPIPIKFSNGSRKPVAAIVFINIDAVKGIYRQVVRAFLLGLSFGFIAVIFLILISIYFLHGFGAGQSRNEYIRGGVLVDQKKLKAITAKLSKRKQIRIGDICMPDGVELKHTLFVGGTGTGKSNAIIGFADGVFQTDASAIMYDVSGEYVSLYCREHIDVILNPLDARCPCWTIWDECEQLYDYERFAASLIPDGKGDPFWTNAARVVFTAVAIKLADDPNRSNPLLVDMCVRISTDEIAEFLSDTSAAALINKDSEKTTASIRSVLATYIQPFKYLPTEGEAFSIKDFVLNNPEGKRLFITTKQDQLAALRPLVTAWLDQAIFTQLSLEESKVRRNYLFIDELPSLQQLKALDAFLARSRKVGGCAVLSFQNYPQFKQVYGVNGADAICGHCSTWVIFGTNDIGTARWASEGIGYNETHVVSENISFGANEYRDGVNMFKKLEKSELVLPTDLMRLAEYHAYLRFTRGLPVAKVAFKEHRVHKKAESFIVANRTFDDSAVKCKDKTDDELTMESDSSKEIQELYDME